MDSGFEASKLRSKSKTSLVMLSQAMMRIAERRKRRRVEEERNAVSARAEMEPTRMGVIATVYMGGLIAANQRDAGEGRGGGGP